MGMGTKRWKGSRLGFFVFDKKETNRVGRQRNLVDVFSGQSTQSCESPVHKFMATPGLGDVCSK